MPVQERRQLRLLALEARTDLEDGRAGLGGGCGTRCRCCARTMARLRVTPGTCHVKKSEASTLPPWNGCAFERQRHRVLLGEDRRLVGEDEPPSVVVKLKLRSGVSATGAGTSMPLVASRWNSRNSHAPASAKKSFVRICPRALPFGASRRRVARREALRDRLQGRVVLLRRERQRAEGVPRVCELDDVLRARRRGDVVLDDQRRLQRLPNGAKPNTKRPSPAVVRRRDVVEVDAVDDREQAERLPREIELRRPGPAWLQDLPGRRGARRA